MSAVPGAAPASTTALLVVDMQIYFLDDRFGAGKSRHRLRRAGHQPPRRAVRRAAGR